MNNEEKQKTHDLAKKLLSEQNFAAAVITGAVATLLAAAAYGITVATWAFSYGFAAAGVGIVIGLSMGFLGRGISAILVAGLRTNRKETESTDRLFDAVVDAHKNSRA